MPTLHSALLQLKRLNKRMAGASLDELPEIDQQLRKVFKDVNMQLEAMKLRLEKASEEPVKSDVEVKEAILEATAKLRRDCDRIEELVEELSSNS